MPAETGNRHARQYRDQAQRHAAAPQRADHRAFVVGARAADSGDHEIETAFGDQPQQFLVPAKRRRFRDGSFRPLCSQAPGPIAAPRSRRRGRRDWRPPACPATKVRRRAKLPASRCGRPSGMGTAAASAANLQAAMGCRKPRWSGTRRRRSAMTVAVAMSPTPSMTAPAMCNDRGRRNTRAGRPAPAVSPSHASRCRAVMLS